MTTQDCRREIVQLGREKKELSALLLLALKLPHFWVQLHGEGEIERRFRAEFQRKTWDKDFSKPVVIIVANAPFWNKVLCSSDEELELFTRTGSDRIRGNSLEGEI